MKTLENLARYVADFNLENKPERVIETAKQCILDTVGIASGAKDNPMFQQIKQVYLQYDNFMGTEGAAKPYLASIWGQKEKVNLRLAVFFNAMLAHTLELDDVHTNSKTHIGTVVIPAAWSLAEALHKSGKELLEAVICGYEVMSRIGMGFGVSSHRNKGWHSTGTAGTFGAAAACAKLFGFTAEQIIAAFGLAGTQSCTTWAFISDGATNKVLHPARAAVSGLESCLLVLGGMRGSANILDAKDGGLYAMMSDAYDYSLIDEGLTKEYEILRVDKKPYPCCRSTHCAIDAALALRKDNAINPGDIASVVVKTYLVGLKQCGLTETSKKPQLPTQAKFSTPYVVACALTDGSVTLSHFLPEQIARPELQELLQKVTVVEDEKFTKNYPNHWGCEMEITLLDGRNYVYTVTDASGSVLQPLTFEQICEKFKACCHSFSASWKNTVIKQIMGLETLKSVPALTYSI